MRLAWPGVDRAIAITILNRAWGVAAAPATLLFVATFLTPDEQGFYYAFSGVLGLQVFFELGLGYVVMQTVSHLMARLRIDSARVTGDPQARGQLGRLLADVLRWYAVVCVLFVGVVLFGGGWFLGRSADESSVDWHRAWVLVVPVFGLSILANACFSFLEGMGRVADVALGRLVQSVLGMIAFWLLLVFGWKLMALVALHAIVLAVATAWILWRHLPLLRDVLAHRSAKGSISWRAEIWPFQWRIAASWIAGYFGAQAITLLLFDRLGPAEAGRFGLSLNALAAVATGAAAWMTTRAPRFGGLVAREEIDELDRLFAESRRGALMFGALGVLALLAVVFMLERLEVGMAGRFAPPLALAAMSVATLVNIKVSAEATLLRAFRREPYLALSVVGGLLQVVVAGALSAERDVVLVATGYALVAVGIGFGWAHPMFRRLRREYLSH